MKKAAADKTSNTTRKKDIDTNDCTQLIRFKNMNSWKENELNEMFIEKFCNKLMLFADKEDSEFLEDFIYDEGVSERTFYFWCQKYPEIQNAHEYTMWRLGKKRQKKLEAYDPSKIAVTMSSYSKRWAACEERLSKLKAVQQAQAASGLLLSGVFSTALEQAGITSVGQGESRDTDKT
jgi:hypothetical protein